MSLSLNTDALQFRKSSKGHPIHTVCISSNNISTADVTVIYAM